MLDVPLIIWTDNEGRERVAHLPDLRATPRSAGPTGARMQATEELAEWVKRHGA
ncbi:MAG TPA: hypothetical protein VGM75_39235 [Pseudonocardiaceae bacterium]